MKHNHIAIAVAVVLTQLLGFLWYSPILFQEKWAEGFGLDLTDHRAIEPLPFVVGILGTVLTAYTVSWLLNRLSIRSARSGGALGAIIWAGVAMPLLWTQYQFGQLPTTVALIDGFNMLASLVITGAVLGVWRKKPVTVRDFVGEDSSGIA